MDGNRNVPSGGVVEGSHVHGVDELGATTGGDFLDDRRHLLVKSVRGKAQFAILLFAHGGPLVFLRLGVRAGDGGGDGAVLGVELTGTSGHPVGNVIIKLARNRLYHGLTRGNAILVLFLFLLF